MPLPRPHRSVALASVLVAAAALADPAPPVYDPDPTQKGAGELTGEMWGKIGPTAAIRLTRIDDATRTAYIHRRAGLEVDPFVKSPGHAAGFISFHVVIENLGERRLVFQPQACRIVTSWKDASSPIDLPTIYTAYQINDRPVPEKLDRIRAAILDGEIVLGPGEMKDGLLVYRAVDPQAKRYQVDVTATLTDGSAFAFSAFYKKRKS